MTNRVYKTITYLGGEIDLKIIGFCDRETAIALKLTGIKDIIIPAEGEEIKQWNKIEEQEDIGIIFITEELADKIGKRLREYSLRNLIPIIIEIPDKKGRRKEHIDYISYLIKKAVGVERI
ncbi:MAG: V-type ATP synthase subunit F [Thermoplasmata archaeon]|nr:MAG: V-type ATP synthase subunit F [Thermoplasmata archaeon]